MKGATFWLHWYFVESSFNPRSREGSDLKELKSSGEDFVSIRAPVKGATLALGDLGLQELFQSALT